jgi:hypothetical protein
VDLRGEIQTLGTNLRGEIHSGDADLRGALNQVVVDLRGEIQTSANSLLQQTSEQIRESESRMRRHFDVVGESLRSDIRAIAEGMVASREQVDRRVGEEAGRTDNLGDRVLRLEVRVTRLEDGRKPRRSPRGR